jgi:4-hydroxy-tetrahydrodipicolinate reductase
VLEGLRSWKTRVLDRQAKLLGFLLLLKSGKGFPGGREKVLVRDAPRYKVIVWGTGFVGRQVVRILLDHPRFELVGVIVHSAEKDGVDVGTLCGVAPVGLAASRDARAVLSREAHAVAYFGPTAEFLVENLSNLTLAMEMGKDVVSTSLTPLVYPKECPTAIAGTLQEVCRRTGRTCLTTGIDPGFANDLLPMTLMGVCGRVDRVRVQEILDYSSYAGDYKPMGLGQPMEYRAMLEEPEVLQFGWGMTVPMMADAMGIRLEKVDSVWEKWATPEEIRYEHGVIPAGCCAAIRFEIRGWVAGEPRIVLEHCNRVTKAAAPHWPKGKMYEHDVYRVVIDGEPCIEQETALRDAATRDANRAGCLATGMRAVHAIPAVCAAGPGLISALDLPLIPGFGNIREGTSASR